MVHCAVSAEDGGFDAVGALLAGPDRPTALLCFSDALAAGALRAARDAGLDVPADLTIVGFDDSPLAQRTDPPLTTVRQDAVGEGAGHRGRPGRRPGPPARRPAAAGRAHRAAHRAGRPGQQRPAPTAP